MANFTRGSGLPGTPQWDQYFKHFSNRMDDLKGEIREAVLKAIDHDQEERVEMNSMTSAITDDDIAFEETAAGQRQEGGESSLALGASASSENKHKRAAENSDNEPKAKR